MQSIGVLKNGGLKAAYAIRATISGRLNSCFTPAGRMLLAVPGFAYCQCGSVDD
jgi:hypothetical protein